MADTLLELMVAAAEFAVNTGEPRRVTSCATWRSTRPVDDLDCAESTINYVRREKPELPQDLIDSYFKPNRGVISLNGITAIAPWIHCLDRSFVDHKSFDELRHPPRYEVILTLSTPAISKSGDLAFLEAWMEDGKYSHMGQWTWLLFRRKAGVWVLDWEHLFAIS